MGKSKGGQLMDATQLFTKWAWSVFTCVFLWIFVIAGLREVGYICDDIEVQDSSNGYVMKIFGANKRKRAKTLQT